MQVSLKEKKKKKGPHSQTLKTPNQLRKSRGTGRLNGISQRLRNTSLWGVVGCGRLRQVWDSVKALLPKGYRESNSGRKYGKISPQSRQRSRGPKPGWEKPSNLLSAHGQSKSKGHAEMANGLRGVIQPKRKSASGEADKTKRLGRERVHGGEGRKPIREVPGVLKWGGARLQIIRSQGREWGKRTCSEVMTRKVQVTS